MSDTGARSDESCAVCGAAFDRRIAYPRSTTRPLPIAFTDIALCPGCGTGMALPRHGQPALDEYYARGTYWSQAGDRRAQSLHERNQCRHRARIVLELAGKRQGLRALDVGAGHGWTHYWLERLAPGALAAFDFVEPDDTCSREILARGMRIPATRIPSLAQARPGYDVIFLNHVLEHVADPVPCVGQVASLLLENGLAYFELPHADQRFKRDVFPHTWFFTPAGLQRLAARAGLVEHLRESFGRMPASSVADLGNRIGFRLSAVLGARSLAETFDDRLWHYLPAADGIWLRWVVSRASGAPMPQTSIAPGMKAC